MSIMAEQVKQVISIRDMDSETWKRVRIEALNSGKTVAEYVQEALERMWGSGVQIKPRSLGVTTEVVAKAIVEKAPPRVEVAVAEEDEEEDPTIVKEAPVWVRFDPNKAFPKGGWRCREHRDMQCPMCEPLVEWQERMKREGN